MFRIITVFILLLSIALSHAQDPVYSQYYNAPLQLNPALAGNSISPFLSANVRVQWPSLSSAYNSYSLNYDQQIEGSNSGFGIGILNDQAGNGILKHTKINATYAYTMRVNSDHFIRGGVRAGFIQQSLDWDKLIFGDAIDPQFGAISPGGTRFPTAEIQPGNTNTTSFDIGFGLVYAGPDFYLGVAIDHLNNPSDEFLTNREKNFPGIPPRYTVHAGYEISLDKGNKLQESTFITPNILFTRQGGFTQLNMGLNLQVRQLVGGLGYRISNVNGDALIFAAGMRVEEWKFVYSFDFTTSQLGISQGGAHELGIVYNIPTRDNGKRDIQNCLNIFR